MMAQTTARRQEGKTKVFRRVWLAIFLAAAGLRVAPAHAQQSQIVLDRGGSAVVLEPYAPNIIRVSLSLLKDQAKAGPGYGFIAAPSPQGWAFQHTDQQDTYHSPRLVVTVAINRPGKPVANIPRPSQSRTLESQNRTVAAQLNKP
jgi:hypothetical protein